MDGCKVWRWFWRWLLALFRRPGLPHRKRRQPGWARSPLGRPVRLPRKPEWVIDELVRLKALMPRAGCRRIADTFNRCHRAKRKVGVSKSFVAYTLRRERYAVECRRRELRRRTPHSPNRNYVWALDLTGKQDIHGQQHGILGVLDHGTRRLLVLRTLLSKSAWTVLGYVFLAIGRYGKPHALRTDNERVFTGRVFTRTLRWSGIRHQRSDVGCPWQNGRIERLFGTLKRKLDHWRVLNGGQLQAALQTFGFWYNTVRPHQNLGGRTPLEVWNGVDPYQRMPKRVEWFKAWEGLLTGFYLSG